MSDEYIVKLGRVESIDDEAEGGRIKVRLTEDKNKPLKDLPYAFPINPKMFQCMPKVGESALIITSQAGNGLSQRYYLGPVVSQMQDIYNAPYKSSASEATALLQGGSIVTYRKPISQYSDTDGAFPDKNDIALIGRKSEDVILKDGELDLRCGIRRDALSDEDIDKTGPIILNSENPAYIQMRYKDHLTAAADSMVNIVADRINIVSHQDKDNAIDIPLVNPNSKKNGSTQPLIQDKDMETLMSQLHQVPYGDILVEILEKMRNIIVDHTHNSSGLPTCQEAKVKDFNAIDFNSILSKHVRIS